MFQSLYQDGSLSVMSAGEEVVPDTELADMLRQFGELQRPLGMKASEAEF